MTFCINKPIFFRRFCLLLLLNAFQASATNKCQSRLYCKSGEAKYMGMSELSEQYLNTTAIRRYTGKNIPDCQTQCLRENNCTSMNIRIIEDSTYKCDLLDKNLYSSRSLLVKNSSFIHLFIMVSYRVYFNQHAVHVLFLGLAFVAAIKHRKNLD